MKCIRRKRPGLPAGLACGAFVDLRRQLPSWHAGIRKRGNASPAGRGNDPREATRPHPSSASAGNFCLIGKAGSPLAIGDTAARIRARASLFRRCCSPGPANEDVWQYARRRLAGAVPAPTLSTI
jgi:hypothetical protein